ncbi:hypothetical protein N7540_002958 [Penicillium herquei]|nr:hypothetical protein N7540_002958 [Penicillium herquei]
MEFRALARGLRARPTPWLLNTPRIMQQQPILLSTLRFNSSASSPQPPSASTPTQTTTEASSPSTESTPAPQDAAPKSATSDFDAILNKLDLGARPEPTDTAKNYRNRHIADQISGTTFASAARDLAAVSLASRATELKLGPSLGRQVHVEPEKGVDIAAAIRLLESTCAQNRVKHSANEQRFHVRKGMVRKNLRRSRWRKLFKFSFNETVKKIQRMQAQGW